MSPDGPVELSELDAVVNTVMDVLVVVVIDEPVLGVVVVLEDDRA